MENIKSIEDFLAKTNFEELKAQKKALLNAVENMDQVPTIGKLEGLICFIDAFQDMAVDVYGIDENTVFDLSDEK